ncbi:MAG: inositol monophosphatase family protein [Planctomycetota bacterium]|jgi:myo-inositol-1(or 4)-monophosphatase
MPLEQRDLSRMLETAVVSARLAGQRAMEEINFIKTSIKNSTDLVTQADARCQQIIIDRIKQNYPDHGFIAEEGEQGKIFKQSPRSDRQFWWAIDPIDGTNNFAHHMLLFTISIAVLYEGEPIVGVIFEPATDSMFTAVKGGKAQLNNRRITAGVVEMDTFSSVGLAFSSVGLDSHFDNGVPSWTCEIMKRTRFRNLGTTALQLAYVANGGLVATIVFNPKLWDIAAGTLIAEAAGAVITDWQGKKIYPVDLENYETQEFPMIAANEKVHPEILELLKP